MMPAGLAIIGVSQKALATKSKPSFPRSYFDFEVMLKSNNDGYFPYTPPVHMLCALRASLVLLLGEGLQNVFARHAFFAEGARRAVASWGLNLCSKEPKWYSETVSAIEFPEGFDSTAQFRHASQRYDLVLGLGLNKVAGKVFRIGRLGDLNELMCLQAIAGSEMAMRDMGIPVTARSGTAVAMERYRGMQPVQLKSAA